MMRTICFSVLLVFAIGCATTKPAGSGGEGATKPALLVDQVVAWFVAGDVQSIEKALHPDMAKKINADLLKQGWFSQTGSLGDFVSHRAQYRIQDQGRTMVIASLLFKHGKRAIKVVSDGQNRIIGLRIDTEVRLKPAHRPQMPRGPYPYSIRDVTFTNSRDQTTIAGTLTLPKGDDPVPVVLLITGSGPQDRDSTIAKHKPFWVLADHLTRHGIGVLRVDDRGVGGTGGADKTPNFSDFEGDVNAGVAFLRKTEGVDPARIGLLGHSQGGMIAPLVAAKDPKIAFVVMLAGPAVDGLDLLMRQYLDILRGSAVPEKVIEKIRPVHLKTLKLAAEGAPEIELRAQLVKEVRLVTAFLPAHGTRDQVEAYIQGSADKAIGALLLAWYRDFANFTPSRWLKKLKCPVLALVGSKDIQVAADPNLAATEAALKTGGNTSFEVHKIPNLNHLFQTAKTGKMSEYEVISETFHPATLTQISDWIRKHTGTP